MVAGKDGITFNIKGLRWRDVKGDVEDREKFVDHFYDRIYGWFIDQGRTLSENTNNGFVVLSICCTLIDVFSILHYKLPDKTAGRHARQFLMDEFGLVEGDAEKFYDCFRCGVIHQALIKEDLGIDPQDTSGAMFMHKEAGKLFVNPIELLKGLEGWFTKYIDEAKSDEDDFEALKKRLFKDFDSTG